MNNKKFGKVAVLFGGNSNEREISISSGKSVLKSLKESNIDVIGIDPNTDNLEQLKQFRSSFYLSSWKRWRRWKNTKIFR